MDAWTFISHSNETTLPIKVSLEEMMSRLRNLTDCNLGQFNSSKKTCNVSERDPREADLFFMSKWDPWIMHFVPNPRKNCAQKSFTQKWHDLSQLKKFSASQILTQNDFAPPCSCYTSPPEQNTCRAWFQFFVIPKGCKVLFYLLIIIVS